MTLLYTHFYVYCQNQEHKEYAHIHTHTKKKIVSVLGGGSWREWAYGMTNGHLWESGDGVR